VATANEKLAAFILSGHGPDSQLVAMLLQKGRMDVGEQLEVCYKCFFHPID
jgi:hypothetical protein